MLCRRIGGEREEALKKTGSQLDVSQKAVVNTILLSVLVALGLPWLRPIIGEFASRIFWHILFGQDGTSAWLGVAIAVVSLALAKSRAVGRAFPESEKVAEWVDSKIGWIALTTLPVYAALAFFVAHGHALSLDESSALFQSRVLASGQLSAAVKPELIDWMFPPDAQGFLLFVSRSRGEAISPYWPGYALLLAPFSWLGVPWLCNPVITAGWIYFLHRLTLKITASRQVAAWAVGFAITSPVIALNAATYYAMPAHLLANTIYGWLIARGGRRDGFLAGLVGGYALILHNPLPHLLFSLPWLVFVALKQRRQLLPLLGGYCLFVWPVVTWGSFIGSFDPSPLVATAKAKVQATAAGGDTFSKIINTVKGFFIFPSRDLWLTRFAGLCKLTIWAAPGLVTLALTALRPARENIYLRLMCFSTALTFAAYLFIRYDQGAGWGFRYLHPVWMTFPILAALFLAKTPAANGNGSLPVRRYFACCAVLSLLVLLPFQAFQAEKFIRGQVEQVPSVKAPASITFINLKHGYHTTDLVQNDPYLCNRNWKLIDRGPQLNQTLAKRVLVNPRLDQRGPWGQIWIGDGFVRS